MQEENNPVIEEIEKEIEDTKRKASGDDFEIEIAEEQPKEEQKQEVETKEEETEEYGSKVQNRIKKLVEQRRNAELETKRQQEANDQLSKRLERKKQVKYKIYLTQNLDQDYHKKFQMK